MWVSPRFFSGNRQPETGVTASLPKGAKMKARRAPIFIGCLVLAACDGPHEDAGERLDAQRGATGGESSIISGPAEQAGEQQDRREKEAEEADADRRNAAR